MDAEASGRIRERAINAWYDAPTSGIEFHRRVKVAQSLILIMAGFFSDIWQSATDLRFYLFFILLAGLGLRTLFMIGIYLMIHFSFLSAAVLSAGGRSPDE